jgi:hypothetical protein
LSQFAFACKTISNFDAVGRDGILDWEYDCNWSDYYYIDWRAWPLSSSDFNETASEWGGGPYHNLYEGIGKYDGRDGAQQKEVLFSHYSNLKFDDTKPPGMIASLAIANPTSTSDFNNVYALGLGINTESIYESFFADIYQDEGESWNNEVRLDRVFA